jgi:hypothetical protein
MTFDVQESGSCLSPRLFVVSRILAFSKFRQTVASASNVKRPFASSQTDLSSSVSNSHVFTIFITHAFLQGSNRYVMTSTDQFLNIRGGGGVGKAYFMKRLVRASLDAGRPVAVVARHTTSRAGSH